MSDVDMSNSDTIKISGVAYTKVEARILVAIVNKWLNENAAQPSVQPTASGVGMRARLGHWLISLGQSLIQNGGG